MGTQGHERGLQMSSPLWPRLSLASRAFLGVGLVSLLYLAWPGARQPLQAIVQVGVVGAGALGFHEVWSRDKRKYSDGGLLSPSERVILRLLELVSAVLGLLIVTGRL